MYSLLDTGLGSLQDSICTAEPYYAFQTKGALMQRSDWILISTLVVLGLAAEIAIGVLTVMGPSEYTEYIEFGIAMLLFVVSSVQDGCKGKQHTRMRKGTLPSRAPLPCMRG